MVSLNNFKRVAKYGPIRAGLELTAMPLVHKVFPKARGRGVIFTLHHVRPHIVQSFAPNALLSVTPEFLEEAIRVALENNLTPIHLHDLPAAFADKTQEGGFVAFTLDDGYKNNMQFAATIFKKYKIPYTIFINAGFVERRRSIWWETAEALTRQASSFDFDFGQGSQEVPCHTLAQKWEAFERLALYVRTEDEDTAIQRIDAAAEAQGIAPMAIVDDLVMAAEELKVLGADPLVHFGAHTVNHINMRRVSDERLKEEIESSTQAIENYVGVRPRSFSYPYGWTTAVGEREAEAVARAGFKVAVTTQPGVLTAERFQHPTQLPRVSLNGYYQRRRYVSALLSGIPFRLMG